MGRGGFLRVSCTCLLCLKVWSIDDVTVLYSVRTTFRIKLTVVNMKQNDNSSPDNCKSQSGMRYGLWTSKSPACRVTKESACTSPQNIQHNMRCGDRERRYYPPGVKSLIRVKKSKLFANANTLPRRLRSMSAPTHAKTLCFNKHYLWCQLCLTHL